MSDRTIYTALGATAYYGAWAFRAFLSKRDAETFVAQCNAYPRFDRQYPDIDLPEDQYAALEKKWQRAHDRWQGRHPAGKAHSDYDEYRVGRMKLTERLCAPTIQNTEKP